jgi:hypothetical protein
MKKTICLILILLFVITALCGCGEKNFVKAKDGDFSVTLPPEVISGLQNNSSGEGEPQISAEEKDFVGVWKLHHISDGGSITTYNNSYYIFADDGSYSLAIAGQTSSGRFSVKDNTLYLGNTPLTYTIKNDELTLRTRNNKTHVLSKIEQANG